MNVFGDSEEWSTSLPHVTPPTMYVLLYQNVNGMENIINLFNILLSLHYKFDKLLVYYVIDLIRIIFDHSFWVELYTFATVVL